MLIVKENTFHHSPQPFPHPHVPDHDKFTATHDNQIFFTDDIDGIDDVDEGHVDEGEDDDDLLPPHPP